VLVNKKVVDRNVMLAIMYMHQVAKARRIEVVGLEIFVYSLLMSCREYVENYVGQKAVDEAVSALSFRLYGDGNPKPDVDGGSPVKTLFSKEISSILAARTGGGGVMACLFDAMLASNDISGMMGSCGLTINEVQNGVAVEAVNKARTLSAQAAGRGVKEAKDEVRAKSGKKRGSETPSRKEDPFASFCVDLTDMAREGRLPKSFGREAETGRLILTLLRKTKGNPLLIGEPGVGKTAIVERFAQMVVDESVPVRLIGCTVYCIDIAGMLSGTNLRGMLEEKIKSFMEEVAKRKDVIVFIDEIHMAVGAGDHGSADIANMMKPYLARGNVRCIGATTVGDYNKYMRKDGAFCRRFQRIVIDEMTPSQVEDILYSCQKSYEDFHAVSIMDDAIQSAVTLSKRFMPDRRFPDKALDCIDDACARASLYKTIVDVSIVEESVSALSTIPLNIVRASDVDRLEDARNRIPTEILGNDEAICAMCDAVSARVKSKQARNRPLCTVIVHGPPGVGKKSAVRLLAESMYGDKSVIEIDGNDFVLSHSISNIIGAPVGYLGYEDDGLLYSSVRKKPYSFVMISNFAVMHPVVRSQIVRILKSGVVDDVRGNPADFRSTMLFFVNDDVSKNALGFSSLQSSCDLEKAVWSSILNETDAEISFKQVDPETMRRIAWMEAAAVEESSSGYTKLGDAIVSAAFERCSKASPSDLRRSIRKELERTAVFTA